MGRRIHSETAYVYFDKLLARDGARRIATTLQSCRRCCSGPDLDLGSGQNAPAAVSGPARGILADGAGDAAFQTDIVRGLSACGEGMAGTCIDKNSAGQDGRHEQEPSQKASIVLSVEVAAPRHWGAPVLWRPTGVRK
jgi:hypothetical protein